LLDAAASGHDSTSTHISRAAARAIAQQTIAEVRDAIGLPPQRL